MVIKEDLESYTPCLVFVPHSLYAPPPLFGTAVTGSLSYRADGLLVDGQIELIDDGAGNAVGHM